MLNAVVNSKRKDEELYIMEATKLASFTYENQKLERSMMNRVSLPLAIFSANWPCFWGEEVTGDMETWDSKFSKGFTDGWKFTCGLRRIRAPCIVYSLGSAGNMAFEKEVLRVNPGCVIHIFDKDNYGMEKWFSNETANSHVFFHRVFIGNTNDANSNPPMMTLQKIMSQNTHHHIDILKMDIEGAEWEILKNELPSIGQLLLELHLSVLPKNDHVRLSNLNVVFNNLEAHGLRLFHKEINARWDMSCVEYAFIQEKWTPSNKSYRNITS